MFNKVREVMEIVENYLGSNCDGLYINQDAIYDGDYQVLLSCFDSDNPTIVETEEYDEIKMGASKMVIVPFNKDYVIKIPFTHIYTYDSDEEEYYFEGEVKVDICALEDEIYAGASKELQSILMPNIYIGKFNNRVPIYIQKKIDTLGCERDGAAILYNNTNMASRRIVRYISAHFYCSITSDSLAPMLHTLGITKMKKLLNELGDLSDLHRGNWGFLKDGSLAIIDYGGFNPDILYG